jgi:dephospho-CoA kinase
VSRRPYVIGLTGNIATGKSTVGKALSELGAEHVDADKLAHRVIAPNTPAWEKIVATFGAKILKSDGEIDRRKLGDIVFADADALARLEAIVHPQVVAHIEQLIATWAVSAEAKSVIVIEAIKLIESGIADQLCDTVWVVAAPREAQIQRLGELRRLSYADAALRVDAQPPQEDKLARADTVIDNSGNVDEMMVQVRREWNKMADKIASL